jgi:hypothetical protein
MAENIITEYFYYDIYRNLGAVAVSFLIIILFFITQTIELNKVLLDFGVSDNAITRAKLIFTYLGGYFLFAVKFTIALLTFLFLICIIVIIISTCIYMFKPLDVTNANVDSTQKVEKEENSIAEFLKKSIVSVTRYIISFILIEQFSLINLVTIPCFLCFFYLFYALILYQPKNIVDDDNKSNIMNTNHMYLYFIFVSIMILMLLYLIYIYIEEYQNAN